MPLSEKYRRTFEELQEVASMFWPTELSEQEAELSIIPTLLETQDDFIAILNVKVPDIDRLFTIVDSSELPGNLFLKHLMVLSDVSGERLSSINKGFKMLFPSNRLDYIWNDQEHTYHFVSMPTKGFGANKLGVNSKKLLKKQPLNDLHKDAIAIIIFGSSCLDDYTAEKLSKCEIGEYLGQRHELDRFIKQRYIWVSRQIGGAKANNLGQLAQQFVLKYLQNNLDTHKLEIHQNGSIPGISQDQDNRLTTFDIVISDKNKHVAVEVSFQETTNSTVERKRGQAQARFEQIEQSGNRVAYVIDGAGNFRRENFVRNLCAYSHCAVAFSEAELSILCDFITEYFQS